MKLTEKLLEKLGKEAFDAIKEQVTDLDEMFDLKDETARIPKERLDKEIEKRKELENKISELQASTATLEEKEKTLAELNAKVEQFAKEKAQMEKETYLKDVFAKTGVKDTDYIKFKLQADTLELKDGRIDGLEAKLEELKKDESLANFFTKVETAGFDENGGADTKNHGGKITITSEDDILKMTSEQIQANMKEIDAFYKK